MKKYTEILSALDVIMSVGGKIDREDSHHILIKSGALGLHKLGAIDFLRMHHHYQITWFHN